MELKGYTHSRNADLDATFAALSDPTRRAILARLVKGEASVAELASPFEMTQPAVSKHLKVLEAAGLITRNRDAQRRLSRLDGKPLARAAAWLADYRELWDASLQPLDKVFDERKESKKKEKKRKHKKH